MIWTALLGCSSPWDTATPSHCAQSATGMVCAHDTVQIEGRDVHHQVPLGEPPAAGWPVALLFQGSMAPADTFWTVLDTDALGYWNQGLVTKTLLDSGVAVITPEALGEGLTAWGTNVPPTSVDWESGRDHALMLGVFERIEAGDLGPLDDQSLYAAGISSGGYMSSRMADAYPGRFQALAIHSGAYMTCTNLACRTPAQPADHPPTLFLHGGLDLVVPARTMRAYDAALQAAGVETRVVVDPRAGHAWIDAAPDEIAAWFQGP